MDKTPKPLTQAQLESCGLDKKTASIVWDITTAAYNGDQRARQLIEKVEAQSAQSKRSFSTKAATATMISGTVVSIGCVIANRRALDARFCWATAGTLGVAAITYAVKKRADYRTKEVQEELALKRANVALRAYTNDFMDEFGCKVQ